MKNYSQTVTMIGVVVERKENEHQFTIRCRSGDQVSVRCGGSSWFEILTNLDGLNRDRVPAPKNFTSEDGIASNIAKYVAVGRMIIVHGIYQENQGNRALEARKMTLMHSDPQRYVFEETHWWLTQITQLANRWLDDMFSDRRTYTADDFAQFYRTNLNIQGEPTIDTTQECATLSRLIYGLASSYLLTGNIRYFLAAKAGVEYQRQTFRRLSHDGKYCFWAYGRRKDKEGYVQIMNSENADDLGTIPLYDQIYALAGLTQYYRITLDTEVLADIRRTVDAFQDFYYDGNEQPIKDKGFPGLGGYFSHLDPVAMRPDTDYLDNLPGTGAKNRSRKNWNSVGDHIPAYLINLILALDPVGKGLKDEQTNKLLDTCLKILGETSNLIADKFPPKDGSKFVNERFFADWAPDHGWFWQQNRGIVGHNLKIAWNLTRVAFYYQSQAILKGNSAPGEAAKFTKDANKFLSTAREIAHHMAEVGVDQLRGGIFDAMERQPTNGMPMEFSWGNTKDFWQQEQGILAYLILHGADGDGQDNDYLQLARESIAFWNAFFLDRKRQGVFFRTSEDGRPVIEDQYSDKGGHSISGYHVFELNFLAHYYMRTYVSHSIDPSDARFNVYFRVLPGCGQKSINVLPDFMRPDSLTIEQIMVNGQDLTTRFKPRSPSIFQIDLELENDDTETSIVVTFRVLGGRKNPLPGMGL